MTETPGPTKRSHKYHNTIMISIFVKDKDREQEDSTPQI